MSSRDKILAAVKRAQPEALPIPQIESISISQGDLKKFQTVLESIGGKMFEISSMADVEAIIGQIFPEANRIISSVNELEKYGFPEEENLIHHSLQDVDVAIIESQLAVAENGAVWVIEAELKVRVLPFICLHLVTVVNNKNLVNTMHEAYELIGNKEYGFGTFIAGPSKTADIEQSLVLGAHGPKTMTILMIV